MPIGIWALEWLNHNSQRNYPLADTADRVDQSGAFVLPNDFLVELDLPVHAGLGVDPARFFVRSVAAYATGYVIVVGYQPVSGPAVDVATAAVSRSTHTPYKPYSLAGLDEFEDTQGKLVIGRLDNIDQQPPGLWTFAFESTRLDPDAIRPILRGVSSVVCVNGSQASERLYGDIVLEAGANCQITPILQAGQDPIIRISFIEGAGATGDCVCEGDAQPTAPITSIQGITPTPDGEFFVLGSECIRVEPVANGIRIVNTCAKPCCGCPELERITADLEQLRIQAATVEDLTRRLDSAVTTMHTVVLGARLKDQGCQDCT